MECMYTARKEDLFYAIKAGGIYFDALFAVLYDGLAEIDRNKTIKTDDGQDVIIYKDNGIGDKLNFFVLTYDKYGNIFVSAYIKTEEALGFLCGFLEKFILEYECLSDYTISVTDYYKSFVNDRIGSGKVFPSSILRVESSGIYTPFCCVYPDKIKTVLVQNFHGGAVPSVLLMDSGDESLCGAFREDPDDYLEEIFAYTIKEPVYEKCGIYAVFTPDEQPVFAGYLAFYSIENYLDISYVYVAEKRRRQGFADALMSAFINYCKENGYIPYYSNADGEGSKRLAEKYGFEPLGERIEYIYNIQESGYEYGN